MRRFEDAPERVVVRNVQRTAVAKSVLRWCGFGLYRGTSGALFLDVGGEKLPATQHRWCSSAPLIKLIAVIRRTVKSISRAAFDKAARCTQHLMANSSRRCSRPEPCGSTMLQRRSAVAVVQQLPSLAPTTYRRECLASVATSPKDPPAPATFPTAVHRAFRPRSGNSAARHKQTHSVLPCRHVHELSIGRSWICSPHFRRNS